MLAPLDLAHQPGEIGERSRQVAHDLLLNVPFGTRRNDAERVQGVQDLRVPRRPRLGAELRGIRQLLRLRDGIGGVGEDEPQGIRGAIEQLRHPQGVDGGCDLLAVRREAEGELRPLQRAVGGHRHQVGGVQALDDVLGRVPRLGERLRLGEGKVEQHQEVPPRRGGDLCRGRSARRRRRSGEVEHLEAGDGHLLTAVEDLEIGGGQAADGLAVLDHLDGNLDDHDVGGSRERLLSGRGPGRRQRAGGREHGGEKSKTTALFHTSSFQPSMDLHMAGSKKTILTVPLISLRHPPRTRRCSFRRRPRRRSG